MAGITRAIIQKLHREDFPSKWVWESVVWEEIRAEIVKQIMETPSVKSLQTSEYVETIEVNLPIRFYWNEEGFDGISFCYPVRELFDWEQEMLDKCLRAMKESDIEL